MGTIIEGIKFYNMPKTIKEKTTQINLRLSEAEIKQVREIAKSKNISVSKLILTSVIKSK